MLPSRPSKVTPVGAGVVKDAGSNTVASSGTGWVKPPQVDQWRAPGIEHVDALVDAQDAVDKAERVRKLAQTEALRRAEAELKARQLGLSHEEWARLSEKDIANHKAQQAKRAEVKK
jgi:hypothetical protein